MKQIHTVVLLACSGLTCLTSYGQSIDGNAPVAPVQNRSSRDINSVRSALNLRMEMVAAVVEGREKLEDAVARLKTQASPTGLNIELDADFAFAATDIGLRLLVVHKQVEALKFLTEAEKSLTAVIERTSDKLAREKSHYLAARADLRARYLKQPAAAKADIIAAVSLQPEDEHLQRQSLVLRSERAEYFKDAGKN